VFDGSLEAMKVLTRTLLIVLAAPSAHAGSILDYIRNYDLNDYALGLSYSISESPYRGGDSNGIVYPYLTSFRHNAFTDDWLILTGGDVGVRWVNESGWVLGAVTRIRTEGTDSTLLDELADIDIRKWRVEAAPLIGWRRWVVQRNIQQLRRAHDGVQDVAAEGTSLGMVRAGGDVRK
jgi:hypothetical protein